MGDPLGVFGGDQDAGAGDAIRFLQALFESSTFTGCHWILGSWYKEEELGKRSGIFSTFAQMGSLWSE